MLKRDITYETFDGEMVTEPFYFNITQPELLEMEVAIEGGFGDFLQRIVKAEDQKALIEEFKKIILFSYGQKSEDGKRFVKSPELREEFEQSAAYAQLFMELATSDGFAVEFLQGIFPRSMQADIQRATEEVQAKQLNESPKPPTA